MLTRRIAARLRRGKASVLLLGPRQTGKSTLMRSLAPDLTFNLADEEVFLRFASNPGELRARLGARPGRARTTVFLDEVQRLPSVLNTVQAVLDEEPARYRFLLTGSSARKLRRGNANLLPGRVHAYQLGPIAAAEMAYRLPAREVLSTGTLPGVLTENDPEHRRKTLSSYAATYLREEIQAESLSRSLEGFSRFLTVVAEASGRFLDVAKLAAAAMVPRASVARWVEVLEDTLLVRRVGSFAKSTTRRLVQHPKLYFFDGGVLNGLLGNFEVSADRLGFLFEHLVANQILDSAASLDLPVRLSTFRTEHGAEVDFIVEWDRRVWAIECKSGARVRGTDLGGLARFADYFGKRHEARVWTLGPEARAEAGVLVLPWQEGLREMGL
jgi:predicted AAA+ superfamily ATPase